MSLAQIGEGRASNRIAARAGGADGFSTQDAGQVRYGGVRVVGRGSIDGRARVVGGCVAGVHVVGAKVGARRVPDAGLGDRILP
jgi:hypothetical protein